MTSEQVRTALKDQPFRPFVLKTTGGREYAVNHPETAILSPGGKALFVFIAPDAGIILDVLMIESIHFGESAKKNRRRSA